MFNGSIPIVLDTLKQHYFIDRDGKSFRYVLNFMRTGKLVLPERFDDHEALLEEAKYYELDGMVQQLEEILNVRQKRFKPDSLVSCDQKSAEYVASSSTSTSTDPTNDSIQIEDTGKSICSNSSTSTATNCTNEAQSDLKSA